MKLSKTKLRTTSKAGLTASNVKLMTQSKAGKRFQGAAREDDDVLDEDTEEQWMQSKVLVKPDDQLQLTEQEMKEEFTRILTANNPHAPSNIVRYNFKERTYKATSSVDQLAVHFSIDGYMVHKDSDEALRQLARQGNAIDEVTSQQSIGVDTGTQTADPADSEERKTEGGEGDGGGGEETAATPAPPSGAGKKLTNQFNFSNRATQTYNNTLRSTETMTEPPPRVTFSGSATQWEIHDAYVEDLERQEREKEKKQPSKVSSKEEGKKKKTAVDFQGEDLSRMVKPGKIIERMVNQNVYDEIAQDFKYWEDESDEFKGGQGTLLPLWKFTYSKAKKLTVTAICWNPTYRDLMAIGFGSYEFLNQVSGMICLYSLKNPSFPEFVIENPDSGVLCIDIHSEHPSLIAVGHYDGTVAVYDVKQSCKEPQYKCDARSGQHLDPVWEVRWQRNDLDNNMNFYSVAADGRVVCWTIVKNELRYTDAMVLKVPDGPAASGPGGMQVHGHERGRTFDFHAAREYLYLIGTEDGRIHKCSKGYNKRYIDTFNAHGWIVYAVRWNRYHPKIFASCSADWKVKIWDHCQPEEPVFTFDLNCSVRDVAWSPYSSTVFAAVTTDGKAHVFDLSVNKYEALCEQKVTRKKKSVLTHISFNQYHPILIVGDDNGTVSSLKLSPNLRKAMMDKNRTEETEIAKMDKLLALVREPKAET